MDISNHFEAIVEDLIEKIQDTVNARVQDSIEKNLELKLAEYDFDSAVAKGMAPAIEERITNFTFDTRTINQTLNNVAVASSKQLADDLRKQVTESVLKEIQELDIRSMINEQVLDIVTARLEVTQFPNESISAAAIKFDGEKISGDNIQGGIISNFSSTGIEDRASACQVTVLDTHVVVESPILTTGLDVRGDVKITGNMFVDGVLSTDSPAYVALVRDTVGAVKESLNEELFKNFSHLVYEDIKENGIEFSEILINGRLVLNDTKLGPGVIHSNLRQVGVLEELQVSGESLLGKTLYVSGKRVGVNTLEPSSALTVWDEEVELVAAKKQKNVGFIGSLRPVTVIIGANNKENISLDSDGSVTINDLRLGALPLSTASVEPTWSGRAGEIVFNDSPGIGKPIGWVCLEGTRWGKFGIISE